MADDLPDIPDEIIRAMHRSAVSVARRSRQKQKDKWVSKARALFDPGGRLHCCVCLKYSAISQAHHITPLGEQYDRGSVEPDHSHVWLCPNHHVVMHRLLGSTDLTKDDLVRLLEGTTQLERERIQQVFMLARRESSE